MRSHPHVAFSPSAIGPFLRECHWLEIPSLPPTTLISRLPSFIGEHTPGTASPGHGHTRRSRRDNLAAGSR